MINFKKFREEYDFKKIALAITLLLGIVTGVFLVQDSIDIRNRAANSCPVGVLQVVKCQFTVTSDVPFTYNVAVTSGSSDETTTDGIFLASSGEKEFTPTGPTSTITEEFNLTYTGTYNCTVKVNATVTNACGSKSAGDEKSTSLACTPEDDTSPPTPTIPDDGGSLPICQDCSKVEVKLDYDEPTPGQLQPTLTPPNEYKDDLKIGRLTIEFKGECGATMTCDDIRKIEFRAYDNDSCTGQPNLTPIPLNSEDSDDLFGRYGSSIKCSDALIKAGEDYNEGARFRLHQANGDQCRCYKVNVEFKDDPEGRPVCPNMPKENICCSNECVPPEIIDNPNDPNDGCPGDPDGPRPHDTPQCYFEPQTSCPRRRAETHFKSYTGGSGGNFGWDDDFRGAADGNDEPVGNLDGEDHHYNYEDGGSYDVKLTCTNGQTCKKRIRVTCNDNPPGDGNPPGGGGGGNNPPPPTGPIACVVPDISGICIDQPAE